MNSDSNSPEYIYSAHKSTAEDLYIAKTREITDEEIGDPQELRGVIETIDLEMMLHEVSEDEIFDLNLTLLSGQNTDDTQTEATIASLAKSQDLLDLRAEAVQSPLLVAKIAMRSILVNGAKARYDIDLLIAAETLSRNYTAWYDEAVLEDAERSESS